LVDQDLERISLQQFLARLYPFFRNPKPDAETIMGRLFYFLDLSENQ
jgi:hypothetical protein